MSKNEKHEYSEAEKAWAVQRLFEELEKGRASVKSDADWLTLDEVQQSLGCLTEKE